MAVASPLRWHGGKSYLAKRIRALFPPHTRYCEPFFGGGSVLLAGDGDNVAEFANDLHYELTNFWTVLKRPDLFEQFQRAVEATPFSDVEFANSTWDTRQPMRAVPWAVAFFIRNRQSRQGLGRDFATPTNRLRRRMNENVSAWLSAVDGLSEVHARLRRVEIRHQTAIEFIQDLDSPETLFYGDPPYVHETRATTGEYKHEMTADDHAELLLTLSEIKGKFLLSGYRCQLYDEAADAYGWRHVDFDLPNNASSKATKERKVEAVWMNY